MTRRFLQGFLLLLLLTLTLTLSFIATPTVQAQDCNASRDLKLHGQSSLIGPNFNTGVIVNRSASCSYQVGIASYKRFDNNIDNQQLFDYRTATIGPNRTITIGPISLPNCASQVDLFYGALIRSFAGGVRYGERLLDAENVGTTFCTRTPPEQTGNQGCTPGYWKNHLRAWGPTGYTPTRLASTVFAPIPGDLGNRTLLQTLDGGGGSGEIGAARILLRAAVAALLNAAHPNVAYPRTSDAIIRDVNAALASRNRTTMLNLADALDRDNNRGCPLN